MLVNIDFTSKDTSMWLSGICIVFMVLMKSSIDCSLCLDSSIIGFSMVVKYLESSYVGDPQNETMGRMCMLVLFSFGSLYSFRGCGTKHLSRKNSGLQITSFCLSENIFLLSLRFKFWCWVSSKYFVSLFVVDKCIHLVVVVFLVHDKSYASFVCG